MALKLWIDDPRELGFIHDLIHDQFFDSEGIKLDSETSTLTIPFQRESAEATEVRPIFWSLRRKRHAVMRESYLRIYKAEKFSIKDTEAVRFYDFNFIEYAPERNCIRIRTGIPVEIDVAVRNFEISVEVTDRIVTNYRRLVSSTPRTA